MKKNFPSVLIRRAMCVFAALALLTVGNLTCWSQPAAAYPFYAQQAYSNPREATGRIVCANCHLGAKPTQVEVPQSVLPDTVFEAVVKIPYDTSVQQVLGSGDKGPLNVGAVLMLPEGFKIAPSERIPAEIQEKVGGVFYQPYSETQENIVLVGPLPGEQYQEIVFPVLSPDPVADKNIHFGKYSVHVGGNRGRGQLQPAGDRTNNNIINASAAGKITQVTKTEGGGYDVIIETSEGQTVTDMIPVGPELIVSEGDEVEAGAALTNNPNVGGFGQAEGEVVLQSPTRVKWLMAFFAAVMLSQILLILKKKQVERVQEAEMNF